MLEFFRRLRYLLNRRRFDRELAGDMEFHREMAACEGHAPFGNTLRLREEAREAWGWIWIERLSQDLRYAARMLRKSPGFTVVAVLMLALGIGVNVAAFGFFNLLVLKPLPVRDPGTLLKFDRSSPGNFADNLPYAAVAFYRAHCKSLSAVMALHFARLTIEGEEKPLHAQFVTPNLFSELGAQASLGRMLDASRDDLASSDPVVVLGHGFWERHFAADPMIVGKIIRLNGKPATVIGVVSTRFSGLALGQPDLWASMIELPYFIKGNQLDDFGENAVGVMMWGRLQPWANPRIAEEELKSLAAELRRQHPHDIWDKESLPSKPGGYAKSVLGNPGQLYQVLGMVAALCLLILAVTCGNLGSLLLARGVTRGREIAIRISVGAGRPRLFRQLFTESLLLALLGAVAGVVLGYLVLRGLMIQTAVPMWLNPIPDWRVLLFAASIGFTAAILFGLTPAWQATRPRHRAAFMRQILISVQVAASCILLIAATLLVRALHHAVSAPPGFAYQRVVSIDPALSGYSPAQARVYFNRLETRLRALPGIDSISLASNPPLGNRWSVAQTRIADHAADVHFNNVSPSFFKTMSIPLLSGRSFEPGDKRSIIVSESLARLQWPAESPLGKSFRLGLGASSSDDTETVIGVAGSARLVSPEDSDAVEVYKLADASLLPSMVVLVKTSAPPEDLLRPIASAAKSIDPSLFPEVQLMTESFRDRLKVAEYSALSVSVLGSLALLLASLGIVGLVAYAVSQRTKEIGIRIALGAMPFHVLSAVLRQLTWPVFVGLLLGIAAAAASSQILRRMLYGVSNLDPFAYLAAIGIFVVTVALAALLPARRAIRIDPLRALRYD